MKTSKTIKRLFTPGAGLSLREFARTLLSTEHASLVNEWFAHKNGSLERIAKAERVKNKGAMIAAQKFAKAQEKQKKKR